MANITNKDLERVVIDTRDDHVPIKFRPTRALLPKAPSAPAGTIAPAVPPPTPGIGVNPSGKGGIPKALISLLATQTPVKQQSYTNSNITISFTADPSDVNFYAVDIWFVGYHGNPNPQLMSSGNTSPINFLCDSTGETVSVFAQTVSSAGLSAPLTFAAQTVVTLSGTVNAPPPPTIVQTLVNTPTGYQFSFNFISGLLTDVIYVYRIYRNTVNNFATATVIRTVPQDTNSSSTYVFQDVIGSQNTTTYYYWVSAVNTSGLESGLTAAQSGAIVQSGWLIPSNYTSATISIDNANFEASTLVPIPGWLASSATLSYNTATPYSGAQSLQVATSVQFGAAYTMQRWACSAGDKFFISAAMKSDGTAQPRLNIIFLDSTGSYNGSIAAPHGTGTSWSISTATGSAPAGSVSMYVNCDNATAAGAGVGYFDAIIADKIISLDNNVADGSAYLRSPQYAGGISLAENGNFEASPLLPPPGWTAYSGTVLSYETVSPQSGNQSLIIAAPSQYAGAVANRMYSAKPGDAFRISGYVKQAAVGTAGVVAMSFLNAAGAAITSIATPSAGSGAFNFVSATGVAPAGTVSAQMRLQSNGVSGGTFTVDNVFATRQSTSFELTPTSTSGTPTSMSGLCTQSGTSTTILVAASTWQFGDGQVSYNSGSVNPGSLGLWFVYADDPGYAGGAVVYVATATPSVCNAGNGRLVFGNITTIGGGGAISVGGGSGGGGPRGKNQL